MVVRLASGTRVNMSRATSALPDTLPASTAASLRRSSNVRLADTGLPSATAVTRATSARETLPANASP